MEQVQEWLNWLLSKSSKALVAFVGSNPTLSARQNMELFQNEKVVSKDKKAP